MNSTKGLLGTVTSLGFELKFEINHKGDYYTCKVCVFEKMCMEYGAATDSVRVSPLMGACGIRGHFKETVPGKGDYDSVQSIINIEGGHG